jgi:hypothetical protein
MIQVTTIANHKSLGTHEIKPKNTCMRVCIVVLYLLYYFTLVQRSYIVAVVNLFIVAFFVTASAMGQ